MRALAALAVFASYVYGVALAVKQGGFWWIVGHIFVPLMAHIHGLGYLAGLWAS